MNIGCIECGVSSNLVGAFDSLEEANRIAKMFNDNGEAAWRGGGQNIYQVFELPKLPGINAEYLIYLSEEERNNDML
jgi:hypothetical protein